MNNQNNKSNRNNNKDYNNNYNKDYNNNNNFFVKLLANVASNIKETNNEELSKSYHLLCKLLSNNSYKISFNQLNYVRTNLGLTKRTNNETTNNEYANNETTNNETTYNKSTNNEYVNKDTKLDTIN